MAHRVMIVDDEPALATTLAYALKSDGFEVVTASLAQEGLALLRSQPIDLAILDVGLPDMTGFELCKAIRASAQTFCELPVIFLTARSDEIDRVVGLEIGGDDYVTKPFSPREVVARVKVILKRVQTRTSAPMVLPETATDTHSVPVARVGKPRWALIDEARAKITATPGDDAATPLDLTKSEYLILKGMLGSPERVFSRGEIMAMVSPILGASLERTVDAHIKSLRAKLRAVLPSDPIETHRGLGYSIHAHLPPHVPRVDP
jgi:two-component system, OmpR family, catabolic regulation response regulator CreB